jgi:hypothetical protein
VVSTLSARNADAARSSSVVSLSEVRDNSVENAALCFMS